MFDPCVHFFLSVQIVSLDPASHAALIQAPTENVAGGNKIGSDHASISTLDQANAAQSTESDANQSIALYTTPPYTIHVDLVARVLCP